jgi:hypothetical protein
MSAVSEREQESATVLLKRKPEVNRWQRFFLSKRLGTTCLFQPDQWFDKQRQKIIKPDTRQIHSGQTH